MDVFEIPPGSTSFDGLRRAERPDPEPGPGQVCVRMRACSLNYRDLMVATGQYLGGPPERALIPLSDGAGEVEAVGEGVSRFDVGDRVVGLFAQTPPGEPRAAEPQPLGGAQDGALAQKRLSYEDDLLPVPQPLSFEEAATLPCAAVTAWHALMGAGQPLRAGQTALCLGTGGVSIFALQFAKAAGARVIITSSSNEKLEKARALGADETINYEDTPDWHEAVLEKTGGRGADAIVEIGGIGTLGRSYRAVAQNGKIGLIGLLADADEVPDPRALLGSQASLHGIFVGGRTLFSEMNRCIAVHDLQPVIDRTFDFDQAPEAYRYQERAEHVGKIVLTVD